MKKLFLITILLLISANLVFASSNTSERYTENEISIKEFFEVKLDLISKALELQAREYERRLDNLNNEARQLKEMQTTYLPRETWELKLVQLEKNGKDNFTLWVSLASVVIALISLFLRISK